MECLRVEWVKSHKNKDIRLQHKRQLLTSCFQQILDRVYLVEEWCRAECRRHSGTNIWKRSQNMGCRASSSRLWRRWYFVTFISYCAKELSWIKSSHKRKTTSLLNNTRPLLRSHMLSFPSSACSTNKRCLFTHIHSGALFVLKK